MLYNCLFNAERGKETVGDSRVDRTRLMIFDRRRHMTRKLEPMEDNGAEYL